jgi:hypothetical protein
VCADRAGSGPKGRAGRRPPPLANRGRPAAAQRGCGLPRRRRRERAARSGRRACAARSRGTRFLLHASSGFESSIRRSSSTRSR